VKPAGSHRDRLATATPSNGFYGWRLLVSLWVVYTIPIGFVFYGPAVLYPFMIEDLGWSRGQVMSGSTAFMITFGLVSPLTALMIKRLGARLTIALGGAGLVGAGTLMGILGHVYPLYVILSLVVGGCVSLASMIPVQTVTIAWFSARRALALGLVLGGGAIGGFVAPQWISQSVQGAGGNWRVGWCLIAAASGIAGIVGLLAVRNRPEDMGQFPDGRKPADATEGEQMRPTPARTYRTAHTWTLREALKTPALWFLIAGAAGSFFLWQVLVTQGPLHLKDRGFGASEAAFYYSLAIGLSVVGRFSIAALGDVVEPRILFALGAFCILLGGVLFWFVSPEAMWTVRLYPLLAGFGFGASYVCIPTLIGNYWGPDAFPVISGILSPISVFVQALAAPLAGFFFDVQGTYFSVVLIGWILAGAGFLAVLLCRPPVPRKQKTERRS
jgi:MFS family permease